MTTKEENDLIGEFVEAFSSSVYQRGYKNGIADGNINDGTFAKKIQEAYENGLNNAWECARKIMFNQVNGGLSVDKHTEIFGNVTTFEVLRAYTASEAIAKIKECEEKQKQCDELNIGDEVIITLNNALYKGEKGVVTQVETQVDGYVRVMFSDGYENSYKVEAIEKTDKSYPEFVNILEQLKEDKE